MYALILVTAGFLAAGGMAFYRSHGPNSDRELIKTGRNFVRRAIPDVLKTTFSSERETTVERRPDHKFKIAGWVDIRAQNGTTERHKFSCLLYKDGDIWAGEQVAVISEPEP